jgi:hypothetical protein
MAINYPQGLIAVILAVVSFYGMTYVVIALNIGWRFGYWLSSSVLFALLFMMAIFWLETGLGPRGVEGSWVPIAVSRTPISQAALKGRPLTEPGSYPSSPWEPGTKANKLDAEPDNVTSAVQDCLTTPPDKIAGPQKSTCRDGQELLPSANTIPVINGSPVALVTDVRDLKFTKDQGALIAMGKIVPITRDPRLAKDVKTGKELGPALYMLLVKDKGALRLPPFFAFLIFGALLAFHLYGLNRAEKKKLSPVA